MHSTLNAFDCAAWRSLAWYFVHANSCPPLTLSSTCCLVLKRECRMEFGLSENPSMDEYHMVSFCFLIPWIRVLLEPPYPRNYVRPLNLRFGLTQRPLEVCVYSWCVKNCTSLNSIGYDCIFYRLPQAHVLKMFWCFQFLRPFKEALWA